MNRLLPVLSFVAACLHPQLALAASDALPPHPRLLLSQAGVSELKLRIAAADWAKTSWDKLQKRNDASVQQPILLPPRGGNWNHNYVCPIHGARLKQGKKIGDWQWEHICPVGDHVLRGDPSKASLDFDGNAMNAIHFGYAREVLENGLIFQVTGDVGSARRAREILLAYADRYHSYVLHDSLGLGDASRSGRVTSAPLQEAKWLIDMTQGADLIWENLSEVDRATITGKLLMPALNEIIIPKKMGIHNIQCRLNSAIGLVGFLLGDEKLIHLAIDDPKNGFRQQIANGIRSDGLWYEGTSNYHFYTIEGLWPLMEAARNSGRDLYGAKYKSLFDGPFALAMPDFNLPNFNDSGIIPLKDCADAYELAFARFHDPDYASLLKVSDRSGRLALLFGAISLPEGRVPHPSTSRNLDPSGYAILQRGDDVGATWLAMKYSPHGGGHGHPDKNSFILYTRGEVLAPDVGMNPYGSRLSAGWAKTTIAHNTLVVDERSQNPAQGKCLAFGHEGGVDYSVTDAGSIYDGVKFVRTAAMLTAQVIVFVDQVRADAEHNFDLAYHQNGVWEDLPPGNPWPLPTATGYSFLTSTKVREMPANGITLKTRMGSGIPAIVIAPGDPRKIITGYGLMGTTEDHVPLLVQRYQGNRALSVWAVSCDGKPVTLRTAEVRDEAGKPVDGTDAVVVYVTTGGKHWSLLVNPGRKSVSDASADGSEWRSDAIISVRNNP